MEMSWPLVLFFSGLVVLPYVVGPRIPGNVGYPTPAYVEGASEP